jgi:hypothetical protein
VKQVIATAIFLLATLLFLSRVIEAGILPFAESGCERMINKTTKNYEYGLFGQLF